MDDAMTIRRGYCNIGSDDEPQNIHYYRCGTGPALLLLHPSPSAASIFLPLLPKLAQYVTAIAIDTPGYGFSDKLASPATDLQPYVDAIESFRAAMGIDELFLYGSATGSQIATEYAKAYPQNCRAIILDNVGDFPEEVYRETINGYFPDLSIDPSGSHLTRIWGMALDVMRFFPWHNHCVESRLLSRPIDASFVQSVATQFLQAGAAYDMAYRVAFVNERADNLLSVTLPTTIIRSSGSIVKAYADRFDRYDWPDNFRMHSCGATVDERQQAVIDVVADAAVACTAASLKPMRKQDGMQIVALDSGNVSIARVQGEGAPWLLLHEIGGSSKMAIEAISGSIGAPENVIAPDLPGHGATDGVDLDRAAYVDYCVDWIDRLMQELSLETVNVLALNNAAGLALHYAAERPAHVAEIVLLNPVASTSSHDLEPRLDGGHLLSLWHYLRNSQLYFEPDDWSADSALDGQPDLNPKRITRKVLDHLLCEKVYASAIADCNAFPTAAAINECKTPLRIVRVEGTTDADRSVRSLSL